MKVISLWSGGKDSCFAAYLAKLKGYRIVSLFNFTDFQGTDSLSHGLSAQIIRKQIAMTGFPFLQKAMPKENYRREFKTLIDEWKAKEDIEGIVFGDIYLQEHKDWIDEICEELKVKPVMPLWGRETKDIIGEFIKIGFKSTVVAVNVDSLGKEWLGREINEDFVEELQKLGSVDFCGEKGEYHSFVYDGPIFKSPVNFKAGNKTLKDKHWFLELLPLKG